MTIGELSSKSAVPASTIRYWERISLLPKPMRVSGKRRYAEDATHRLAVLRLAQACGFTLEEMRHLLHGFGSGIAASRRWQELAGKKQKELENRMEQLRAMRKLVNRVMHCECTEFDDCARLAISALKETAR
jgi:MerR family transcriptional regulator, redox-sensitive transcriptional activator SoxR